MLADILLFMSEKEALAIIKIATWAFFLFVSLLLLGIRFRTFLRQLLKVKSVSLKLPEDIDISLYGQDSDDDSQNAA